MFVSIINAGVYRTGISERSGVIKTTESNKYHICHYWYILDKDFKYESCICNGCYGLMQKAIYFSDVAIVSIKRSDAGLISGVWAKRMQ